MNSKKKNFQASEPCTATGDYILQRCYHHIYTQGAFPQFAHCSWNKLPLTKVRHTEVHAIGIRLFAEKYPNVKKWLLENGWVFEYGKWRHY
jgi:hypothetical protein